MLQLDFITYRIQAMLKVAFYSLWFFQSWHVQNCSNNFKMNPAFSVTHLKQKLQICLCHFLLRYMLCHLNSVLYFAKIQWRHVQSVALYHMELSVRYRMIELELVLVATWNMSSYCRLSYSNRQPCTTCMIIFSLNIHLPFSDFPLIPETILQLGRVTWNTAVGKFVRLSQ